MNTPSELGDDRGTCERVTRVARVCPIGNRYPRAAEGDARLVLEEVYVLGDRIRSHERVWAIDHVSGAYKGHKRVTIISSHLGREGCPRP